jgi:hypothetical protein
MDNRRFPAVLFKLFFQRGYLDLTIRDAKLQIVFYFPNLFLNKILENSMSILAMKIFKKYFFSTFLRSNTANELSEGCLHVVFQIHLFLIFVLAKKLFA